jgi:putative sterol carrier protein
VEVDPASVDPVAFVKAIKDTPDEQLAAGMADAQVREMVLDGIFSQWAEHFDREQAKDTDAVLEWKIFDKPGGGYDCYQVVIKHGTCTVEKDGNHPPRVAFKLKPVDFLKLVSGNAAGPMMFMTGKLKIDGDLMFAAGVQSLFRIPGAA